jgi:hypothetical protein
VTAKKAAEKYGKCEQAQNTREIRCSELEALQARISTIHKLLDLLPSCDIGLDLL